MHWSVSWIVHIVIHVFIRIVFLPKKNPLHITEVGKKNRSVMSYALIFCFAGRYTKYPFYLWRCLLWLGKDSLRKVIKLLFVWICTSLRIILLYLGVICFSKYFCTAQEINTVLLDSAYQYVMRCGTAVGQLLRNLALLML